MAVVKDVATWVEEIYLIDPNDPVQGGEGGIDNLPHQQLANRTKYLKDQIEGLTIPSDLSDELTKEARLRKETEGSGR